MYGGHDELKHCQLKQQKIEKVKARTLCISLHIANPALGCYIEETNLFGDIYVLLRQFKFIS